LGTVGLDWEIAGFADFNHDTMTDMMLRNAAEIADARELPIEANRADEGGIGDRVVGDVVNLQTADIGVYRLAHKLSIHQLSTKPRVRVRRSRCVVEEDVIGELDDGAFTLTSSAVKAFRTRDNRRHRSGFAS
jgi:hypothetical protein